MLTQPIQYESMEYQREQLKAAIRFFIRRVDEEQLLQKEQENEFYSILREAFGGIILDRTL